MTIYSALQIGDYHLNHCEDYLFTGEPGNNKILCAVMDGCTMATDSYFVSTLVGKLLRKIVKEKSYKEMYGLESSDSDVETSLRSILRDLFKELNIVKNQLALDKKELLTTLILLLIDKKTNQGIVLSIGDGVVNINGHITEFDQDNKPDYLGFHLHEAFEQWYEQQTQKISFDIVEDISIATDGITSFKQTGQANPTGEAIDPMTYLLQDRSKAETEEMLELKLKALEHQFGLKPTDDLAVIRLISQ